MWRVGRASDEEGLRLILAFFNIDDPRKRMTLVELAESFAKQANPDYSHADLTARADLQRAEALLQDNEQTSPRKP